jgi:hypothetical protein
VFDSLISLQEFVLGITDDSVEESLTTMMSSEWIQSPLGVCQLARAIMATVNIRPLQIAALASFASQLFRKVGPRSPAVELKPHIFSHIFRIFEYTKPFPNESAYFCFLYECYCHGLFEIEAIFRRLHKMDKQKFFRLSVCWLFCYFAPEMERTNPVLFNRLHSKLSKMSGNIPLPFLKFSEQFTKLKADSGTLFKSQRHYFGHSQTLISRIREDDADGLRQISCHPNYSTETRIAATPFTPFSDQHFPTLIQIAAFFGAVNCFKFLISQGAELRVTDHNDMTLPQFAVAGGNIEIIRLCEQCGLHFLGALHTVVRYQRNEIFDWLSQSISEQFDLMSQTPLH